jgi:branched-subunit amino acid ABC-type transport system permease component
MAIQLLNGLVYGALLFTVTSGHALMFGQRRIVNSAHGSLYMLGAYVGFSVSHHLFGFWVGLFATGGGRDCCRGGQSNRTAIFHLPHVDEIRLGIRSRLFLSQP